MENGFTKYSFTIELKEDQTYDLMQAKILYYTNSDNTESDYVYLATECDINTKESDSVNAPTIEQFTVKQKEDKSKTLVCEFEISGAFRLTASYFTVIQIYVNGVVKYEVKPDDINSTTVRGEPEISVDNYGDYSVTLKASNHWINYDGDVVSSPEVSETLSCNVIGLRPNCTLNCTWSTKTIIDKYGHELICANYPHITVANWEQFCEDINTVGENEPSFSSSFTPIQRGDSISSGLWNELVYAICSIDGSDTTLYIVHPRNKLTPKRVSDLEGKLQDICDLYY
jgi:hypothetical protein